MTSEHWHEVVALFEEALERPAGEREAFVSQAPTSDEHVRSRVLAMLRADSSEHAVLDATQERLSAFVITNATEPGVIGMTIGPYTILREIGRGGMACVFLANDARHRRQVALKLLHRDASYVLGGDRFRREIEVVAQLQHPHILPLYDSGESEGRLYYVMPYVAGETLRARLAREGQLPLDDVRRFAAEVGAALDHAHRRGVVHRDVKPANILLYEDHATIADFGIAHRVLDETGATLTAPGVVIGTPAYMSPEQALGHQGLDARSDVYSLGCVVYEMLAGEPPFRAATTSALLSQHLTAPAPSILTARPDLPPAVVDVLRRALAKDPPERFPSTREFVQALDAALTSHRADPAASTTGPTPNAVRGEPAPTAARAADTPLPARRRVAWQAVAAAAVVLAVVAAFAATRLRSREGGPPSIAVLPFANISPDPANEYFSDGVTEEITGALAQLGRIRVAPRTSAFAYKGRTGDLREIGRVLGVSRILEGSVRRDADRVIVHARLYDATTGEPLWTSKFERDWSSMLALQSEIADTIAAQLQLNLLPRERARIAERHTVQADAYDEYLRGRYLFDLRTAASMTQAVVHFKRALAIDSTYARAYAGLADSYGILAWTGSGSPSTLFAQADSAAQRALQLDSTLAEAYVSLGIIATFHRWDWEAADRATARAIALDSTLSQAWFFRSWHLVAAGRLPEALASLERSRQLEPLLLITNARVGTVLSWMDRYASADSALRRTLEIDAAYPIAKLQLARTLSVQERHAEAIAALPPDSVQFGSYESGIAGWVYARAGQRERALAAARALESRPSVPAEGVAAIYAALGETELALTWLERAVDARGVGLIFLVVEPIYDTLHDHPRFKRVVQRIGLRG